jgi:hypothetical protein
MVSPPRRRRRQAEVDLTADQFLPEEVIVNGQVVTRPPDALRHHREQCELLRDRVVRALADAGRPV